MFSVNSNNTNYNNSYFSPMETSSNMNINHTMHSTSMTPQRSMYSSHPAGNAPPAEKFLYNNCNQSNFHTRTQPAQQGRKPCALFVGDLSFFCTELELAQIFAPFGAIDNLEIKRGRQGDSLMHGFVEFVHDADAKRAMAALDGHKFMGRHMRVYFITHEKVAPKPQSASWVQVHVNFLTTDLSKKITEELLEAVFVTFGLVGDIQVKRHLCSQHPSQVTGYAFVYFLDVHAALRAIHALKNISVENVFFECCLSYKAEQLLNEMQGMTGVIKRQQTPNPSAFFKRFDKQSSPRLNPAAPSANMSGMSNPLPPSAVSFQSKNSTAFHAPRPPLSPTSEFSQFKYHQQPPQNHNSNHSHYAATNTFSSASSCTSHSSFDSYSGASDVGKKMVRDEPEFFHLGGNYRKEESSMPGLLHYVDRMRSDSLTNSTTTSLSFESDSLCFPSFANEAEFSSPTFRSQMNAFDQANVYRLNEMKPFSNDTNASMMPPMRYATSPFSF